MTLIHNHHAFKSIRAFFAALLIGSLVPTLVLGWGAPQKGVEGEEAEPNKEFPAGPTTMPMNVNEVQVNNPPTSPDTRRTINVLVTENIVLIPMNITDPDNDPIRYFRRYNGNVSDGGIYENNLTVYYTLNVDEDAEIVISAVDTDQQHEDGKSKFIQIITLRGIQE